MATNEARLYGSDIACISDADELWSEVEGLEVVKQDAIHVITTDDFLGPGGAGRGFDCRRLIGKNTAELASLQPILVEVLCRDDRINDAQVVLTSTTTRGLADVEIACTCHTDLGPFSFTKSVMDLTTTFGDPES